MGVEIIVDEPAQLSPIGCVIDGGGITISPGYKRGTVTVVGDCTITGWRIIGDTPGSVELDIHRATDLDNYPPSESIIDADPPQVVAAIGAESSDVSTWCGGTAQLDDGNILEFEVKAGVVGFTQIRIELFRTSR